MRRIADTGETAIVIPVILEPIQVRVPLRTAPVKVHHVAVAVGVAPVCTTYHPYHHSLRALPIFELNRVRDI